MSAAGYPVTQLQAPSQDAFGAALAEVGIDWPWGDTLERHRHPGVRLDGPTVGLVVHTVSFDLETDRIDVVQSATEWRDRFVRLVSQIEDIDNLLTSILSVNLTLVSVRQNEDMRRIAAWGAIGIAPTAMAGIWGMNFRHMPELDWGIGYPVALGSIAVVCLLLYRFFKRAGWL